MFSMYNVKKIIYTLLFTCILLGCSSTRESKSIGITSVEGIYFRDGLKNFFLSFQKGTFSYFEKRSGGLAIYTCCDTITKGIYQIDDSNKLLYLSTSDYLNDLVLKVNVQEPSSIMSDSIFINVTNPIELAYLGDSKEKTNRLFYRLKIEGSDFLFLSQISGQIYENSKFNIYIPKDIELNSFSLEIYPNYNSIQLRSFNVQYVTTITYNIKNNKSRIFNVDIPGLDFPYLSYVRLNKDIIKIVDGNRLEWDGHYFLRNPK